MKHLTESTHMELATTQQLNPYIQQLSGADWHMSLIREIMCKFNPVNMKAMFHLMDCICLVSCTKAENF